MILREKSVSKSFYAVEIIDVLDIKLFNLGVKTLGFLVSAQVSLKVIDKVG